MGMEPRIFFHCSACVQLQWLRRVKLHDHNDTLIMTIAHKAISGDLFKTSREYFYITANI